MLKKKFNFTIRIVFSQLFTKYIKKPLKICNLDQALNFFKISEADSSVFSS